MRFAQSLRCHSRLALLLFLGTIDFAHAQFPYTPYVYTPATLANWNINGQQFFPQVAPITGFGGAAAGNIGVRQEIRDLEKDSILWPLYLLGLDFIKGPYTNQTQMPSWFEIMGMPIYYSIEECISNVSIRSSRSTICPFQ